MSLLVVREDKREEDRKGREEEDSLSREDMSRGEGKEDVEKMHREEEPTGFREIFKKWPKATFFIIGNEFCERFSFYGMRSVLTVYLINSLHYSNNTATVLFHAFIMTAYLSPLFGSMLADGFIGKFWTIFLLSIVYAAGQVTLAFASSFNGFSSMHPWLDFLGLLVIAIGTGGIKPCVSSFGGDQFHPNYTKMISLFFSLFYFSINAGSTLSMFITPILRSIPCLGQESCFPLAFGVPALLMLIATGLFTFGSFWYKKVPPAENIIFRVINTIRTALTNKTRGKQHKEEWLDYALDGHECADSKRCSNERCEESEFVHDVKSLIRVVVMMLPFPMFWALYDQQGSRWTIQAMLMDSRIVGELYLLPDQMQVLNAILIMAFIPLFQIIVYPLVDRMGIKITMLRKMAAGGLLAALSFVLCGFVQLAIEGTLVPPVAANSAHVSFVNTYSTDPDLKCTFTLVNNEFGQRVVDTQDVLFDDQKNYMSLPVGSASPSFSIRGLGKNCPVDVPLNMNLENGKTYAVFLTPSGYSLSPSPTDKPQKGHGEFGLSFVLDLPCSYVNQIAPWAECDGVYKGEVAVCRDETCQWDDDSDYYIWKRNGKEIETPLTPYDGSESTRNLLRFSKIDIKPGRYSIHLIDRNFNSGVAGGIDNEMRLDNIILNFNEMGSVYTAVISERGMAALQRSIPPNTISILWQVPQYVVVTAAEVLFSITGLEFAYSEAAPSLKSVVTALYLLTVAIGDLMIIAIAQLNLFSSLVTEMFVFAAAMLVTIGIFILLAVYYYEYAHYDKDDNDDLEMNKNN